VKASSHPISLNRRALEGCDEVNAWDRKTMERFIVGDEQLYASSCGAAKLYRVGCFD
jgi:hypothetical protein